MRTLSDDEAKVNATRPPMAPVQNHQIRRTHRGGLVALGLFALVTGCAAPRTRTHAEALREATVAYYDGMRWQQYAQAAAVLPPQERGPFLERREAERDTLHIVDYEVRRVDVGGETDRATVEVDYTWHQLPSTRLETTRVRQQWQRFEESWLLIGQEEVEVPKDDPKQNHPLF